MKAKNSNCSDNSIYDIYFNDLASLKPLTKEEEARLGQLIAQGDTNARNKLAEHNLLFVVKVAKAYQHLGVELLDLIGAGNLGLLEAAERFDGTRGCKFCTYAYSHIRREIKELLLNAGPVKKSEREMGREIQAKKVTNALRQELGYEPSNVQIADRLKALGLEVPLYLSDKRGMTVSVDTILDHMIEDFESGTDSNTNGDYWANILIVDDSDTQDQIEDMMQPLTEREREIVRLKLGLGDSCPWGNDELADKFTVTPQRIGQILNGAYKKMRDYAELNGISA